MSDFMDLDAPQCFKHGHNWHSRFQQLMNLLRDKFTKENIYRIGNAICTCDAEDRFLPSRILEKIKRRPKDPRWQQLLTEEKVKEIYEYFDNYIEKNYDPTKDEYSHLKNILLVLKERGQLSNRLTSAYRFLYIFYKFDKDNDLSLLDPPEAQGQTPLVSLVMNLESLRPEDIGNYIGTKGVHIKRLLREKKGSKITMEKDDGHVKIQIEALKEDLQEIKDRLLQRETLVVQARRQHEESVKEYIELTGGDPMDIEYHSAEESID